MILIISGYIFTKTLIPAKINTISATTLNATMTSLNLGTTDPNFITVSGFIGEFVFAILLFISPLSIIGGFWIGKLGLQIMYDKAISTSFAMPKVLNVFFALLALILFCYSFYIQYKYIISFKKRDNMSDKELSRLI